MTQNTERGKEIGKGNQGGMRLRSCDRLQEALLQCHRRMPEGPARRSGCRHLNKALAECMVGEACPEEYEAVRSLCASGGTSLKRKQCEEANFSLSLCLSRHQRDYFDQQP
ncbi:unnamed protein product [Eruca vesicaria subsp. sativa]|uniref:COX assembly mitochondrial protein n=1 Tax=Eruca vesicaria subsp. sativa TaxID=29727 RepID=A0ABC8LKZ7_ERUVS|nr:unnamed protein product [Eruca vesicaria subsp. sativa]